MSNRFLSCTAAVLAALFLLPSCIQSDKTTGSDLLPEDQFLKIRKSVLYPEFTLRSPDSLQAISYNALIFGTLTDPVYGTTEIRSIAHLIPSSDTIDFGEDPEFLSAYIQFRVDSTLCLTPDQEGIPQNIYLHKITRKIDSLTVFNTSFSDSDIDPVPITAGSPVFFGKDSIKVYLTADFGRELLATTEKELDSTALFIERIPGLCLRTDPADGTPGGRLNYIPVSTPTIYLNFKYTNKDKGLEDRDTTTYFYFAKNYAINISSSESATLLASDEPGEYLYLETLAGIKPYISGQQMKEMLEAWRREQQIPEHSKILLARAHLDLFYDTPEDYGDFDLFPGSLVPGFRESHPDSLKFLYPLPEVEYSVNIGARNASLQKYTSDVTTYIQELLEMEESAVTSKEDLWIVPLLISENSYQTTFYTVHPTLYRRIRLNGPLSERKPALTLTYSLLEP